jgi:reverse transcriptase-like protein
VDAFTKVRLQQRENSKSYYECILKRRWKNLGKQLRRQLFLDFVEFKDFDNKIGDVVNLLETQIQSASYRPEKPLHYLVEKSRGLCRQMTLCRPDDLLVLETLTASLKAELVDGRPTKNAFFEPDDQKFGRRPDKFGIDDYSATKSWKNFQQAIFKFSKERPYIVITDVANFYDFISFSHLRNIVSSVCNIREELLDLLVFVLNEMSWTPDFMPRSEVGLPQMESNAPRVLANAMLYELDRVAIDRGFGDYVRFMDDIDVGVDSITQAKKTIRDIDLTLQSRQLRLNSSKTKILRSTEAYSYFCIRENRFLDFCSKRINENNVSYSSIQKAVGKAYYIWRGDDLNNSRFTAGNGDKIFKYLAKVGRETGFEIPSEDLLSLIKLQPSMRLTGFNYLSFKNLPNSELYVLCNYFHDGVFVDDLSSVLMAKFCVHARFRADTRVKREIKKIVKYLISLSTEFSIYSALLISSKFFEPEEILEVISSTYEQWQTSYWLGRSIGGLTPIVGTSAATARKFYKLLEKAENSSAFEVYKFHRLIQTQRSEAQKLLNYAKAENYAFPQKIIHPKALIIRSMSQNSDFVTETKLIKSKHTAFYKDPFYRKWKI